MKRTIHHFDWRRGGILAALLISGTAGAATLPARQDDGAVRTIRLRQDDAQVKFCSKVYTLKHVGAEELLPFVKSAILRFDRNSTIRRVTARDGGSEALLVSTGREFMPYVDEIVTALDRASSEKKPSNAEVSAEGSAIGGTGLTRIAYSPRYRAAAELAQIINTVFGSSSGFAAVNEETNTIFWRDQDAAAKRTLAWIEKLDRPLPQVAVRINYYELRDSDLKDWGFDYLAWKNGPGINLLNVGYNAGGLFVNELLEQVPYIFTSTWGLGGIFTAPQIDMSFIRCLQQSGNANAVASGSLMMINTPVGSEKEYQRVRMLQEKYPARAPFIYRISMTPEYQNIAKNVLGRSFVGKSFYEDEDGEMHSDPPQLEMKVVNPFICLDTVPGHPRKEGEKAGGVIFDYSLYFKNVVERGNTGAELSNSALVTGATTLAFGREKILAVYDKENDVEQTIGLPILCRIPILKYLFSTVTTIKERSYIIVTAEATLIDIHAAQKRNTDSVARGIERRIEDPFRSSESEQK